MLSLLIIKEFKSILQSPKFVATIVTCTVLILLSFYIGIQEYKESVAQYETGIAVTDQGIREQTGWGQVQNNVFRQPDPMQIFVSGINNDIGRLSSISNYASVKLRNSHYSDNPLFAVFRFIDITFIFMVVLSLFAIMFTYDAINGERESGTLKLVFSNSVPRAQYLIAKFAGSWLGLVVPLLIPILLGLLMINLFQIPLTSDHWIKIGILFGISFLFFTFFICLGLFVSALTSKSSTSFLILLVSWIALVLILPRIGIMVAGEIVHVPSIAEVESRKDGFTKDSWDSFSKLMQEKWQQRNQEVQNAGKTDAEQQAYRDEKEWSWLEEDDAARKKNQAEIAEFSRKLSEENRNLKTQQEELGFALSRFSPVSSYLLASMTLAETDVALKSRYESGLEEYKKIYTQFVETEQKKSGQSGGIRINMDSKKGFSFQADDGTKTLNATNMPKFQYAQAGIGELFGNTLIDWGLLAIYSIVIFFISFLIFLKYDVR